MGLPSKITSIGTAFLAASIVVVMLGQAVRGGPEDAPARAAVPNGRHAFGIHGIMGDLYPGKRAVLVVRVRNFRPFPITLRWIGAHVRRAGRRCPGDFLTIRPFKGRRRIGARRSVRVRLRVLMKRTAPNACQGLRFPLRFRGKAVRA